MSKKQNIMLLTQKGKYSTVREPIKEQIPK